MKSQKRTKYYLSILACLFVIILYFIWVNQAPSNTKEVNSEIFEVTRMDIQDSIREMGIVELDKTLVIATPIATRLKKLYVQTGDIVNKGQILFELEKKELVILEKDNRASLMKAENELEKLKNQPEEELIQQAETAYIQSSTAYLNAERTSKTGEKLYQEGFLSKVNYQQYLDDLEIARRKFDMAGQAYDKATASVSKDKISTVEAQIEKMKLDLNKIQDQIRDCEYKAPFKGTVLECYIKPDNWEIYPEGIPLSQGNSIIRLGDLNKISVRMDIFENEIQKIKKGQKVLVGSEFIGDKELSGIVEEIGTYALPLGNLRKFPVLVSIQSTNINLKPGMSVEVKLIIDEKQSVVSIPLQYLLEIHGKTAVRIIRDNKRDIAYVETGLDDGKYVEIKKGLTPGERIYIEKSF